MEPKRYTTLQTAPRDRLAYWREAVCDSYVHLGCDAPAENDFHGEIALETLPDLTVSSVAGSTQRVSRRKRDIARSSDAFFLMSVQLKGACRVEQRNRSADLRVGDFALYSSTDPYTLRLPDAFRQLVVQVPRRALLERLPNADQLTGARVAGEDKTAAAVRNSLLSLINCIHGSDDTVRGYLQATLVDLVATGLATLDCGPLHLNSPEEMVLSRARTFISEHLSDPQLDRSQVAAAAGLSVRRLNELFRKSDQSISSAIRDARLQRIATVLQDPRYAKETVSSVALRHGVRNLEHFSQSFRRHFGVTPRDYRARK